MCRYQCVCETSGEPMQDSSCEYSTFPPSIGVERSTKHRASFRLDFTKRSNQKKRSYAVEDTT